MSDMKPLTLITANSRKAPMPAIIQPVVGAYKHYILADHEPGGVQWSGRHVCSITGRIDVRLSQSSQLFSTVSFTRLVYSLRLSLYRFEASTLAGEEVFGSLSRLRPGHVSAERFSRPAISPSTSIDCPHVPLNTCQDRRHIVRWAPSVLEDVQTELAGTIYVRMEHLADELDPGRLIWVLLFEVHNQAESAIFKRSVCWADNNGVPVRDMSVIRNEQMDKTLYQVITLSAIGDAETPAGGSVCIRWNRRSVIPSTSCWM